MKIAKNIKLTPRTLPPTGIWRRLTWAWREAAIASAQATQHRRMERKLRQIRRNTT